MDAFDERVCFEIQDRDVGVTVRDRNGNQDSLELLASKVMSVLGTLDLDYAVGCICDGPVVIAQDHLSYEEAACLIEAATSLNPLDKILAFEKNSASAGLVRSLMQTLNPAGTPISAQSFLSGVGGSVSSPHSPSGTVGTPAS